MVTGLKLRKGEGRNREVGRSVPYTPPLSRRRRARSDARPTGRPIRRFADSGNQGLGLGVGRPLGVGIDLGVGLGLTVAVGVADAVAVAVAVGVGVVVGVGVTVGVAVGLGVALPQGTAGGPGVGCEQGGPGQTRT